MQRKFLEGLRLEKEVVDKIMDVQELQGKITKLTDDLAAKDVEIQQKLSDRDFNDTLKEAITAAGAKNAKAVMVLMDHESLKSSKNQKEDVQKALETVKKDNDYLLQPQKPIPEMVSNQRT